MKLTIALAALAVLPLSACGVHHHHRVVRTTVVHVHGGGVVVPPVHVKVCRSVLRRNPFGHVVRVRVCR